MLLHHFNFKELASPYSGLLCSRILHALCAPETFEPHYHDSNRSSVLSYYLPAEAFRRRRVASSR